MTLLLLLLWDQLKSVISDKLSEITEESLNCQKYWLDMCLFLSFLNYFQIKNLKYDKVTRLTSLIYNFYYKNNFFKVTSGSCTIKILKSPIDLHGKQKVRNY